MEVCTQWRWGCCLSQWEQARDRETFLTFDLGSPRSLSQTSATDRTLPLCFQFVSERLRIFKSRPLRHIFPRNLCFEVILPEGTNANHALVKDGWCWWYQKYAPGNVVLEKLESEAREARIGLWADPHPVPPWEWSGGLLDSIDQNTLSQVRLQAKRISYSADPSTNPAVCE